MIQSRRRGPGDLVRKLLLEHVAFAAMMSGVLVAGVVVILIVILVVGEVESSVWEQASYQVARWYVAFIGGYLTYSLLPLQVANGQTRRAFAGRAPMFIGGFAAGGAVLMVVGFLLEAALYAVAGWPHVLTLEHYYSSPYQLHLVFVEFFVQFLAWMLAGALLGAAIYRSSAVWLPALLLAVVGVGLVELVLAPEWGPFELITELSGIGLGGFPLPLGVGICALSYAMLAAGTWLVIRDMPLRNKVA